MPEISGRPSSLCQNGCWLDEQAGHAVAMLPGTVTVSVRMHMGRQEDYMSKILSKQHVSCELSGFLLALDHRCGSPCRSKQGILVLCCSTLFDFIQGTCLHHVAAFHFISIPPVLDAEGNRGAIAADMRNCFHQVVGASHHHIKR